MTRKEALEQLKPRLTADFLDTLADALELTGDWRSASILTVNYELLCKIAKTEPRDIILLP